jgi:kojibiose phosphorylase
LHVRGSLEEHLTASPQNVSFTRMPGNVTSEKFPETRVKWGTYVPGIFGKHPLLRVEMVNLPCFLGLVPTIAGEKLDMEQSTVSEYRRELHLRTATLRRTLTWHTRSGATVDVTFERFISAARPGLCVQRMTLSSAQALTVTVAAGIDADVRTNGHDHLTATHFSAHATDGVCCRVRTDGGDLVSLQSQLTAPGAAWRYAAEPREAQLVTELTIPLHGTLVVEKRTAVTTSRDLRPTTCAEVLAAAAPHSFATLFREHAAIWDGRWAQSDVSIEGDAPSQLAMRTSLYHLLRVHVPNDCRVTVDAKGYAGDAYFGRFFWDTEMYILPFYLYTDPARARTLVDFRLHGLPAARDNAADYGYQGARYPWEADHLGRENCPNWQYGDHEVHITADVVYGLAHYARALPDPAYLAGPAAEAIVETARYWLDRLDWRAGDDYPSLLGVMGPDEYTPMSSNNSYTNRLVKHALALAATLGAYTGATAAECARFAEVAELLPVLRAPDGLVLQCEEFARFAEPRFEEYWQDRGKTFAAQVSQERLYRSKCLKQADVLMLMYLFPREFTDDDVRRAWDYYLPYTTHDSSLSAGAHAIIACRLGRIADAWTFWQASSAIDLDIDHGAVAEGIHIAGAGANWQIAVLGFAGMATAMTAETLTLRPQLPPAWTRLAFPLIWHGCPVFVEILPDSATVTNRGEQTLEVCLGDRQATLQPGASLTVVRPVLTPT